MARLLLWIAVPIVILLIVLLRQPFPGANNTPKLASEAALAGALKVPLELEPRAPIEPEQKVIAIDAAAAVGSSTNNNAAPTAKPEVKPSIVRRSSSHWALEAGPLRLEVELGKMQKMVIEKSPLKHAGDDCWSMCAPGGMCPSYCGQGNACCRRGFAGDPTVCRGGKNFQTSHHECVTVEVEIYKEAKLTLFHGDRAILASPAEGLWSVGSELQRGWPSKWDGGGVDSIDVVGPWIIITGYIETKAGAWSVSDRWRIYDGLVEGVRSWVWTGKETSPKSVLSIGWVADGQGIGLSMPGVLYHGNPSGTKALKRGWALVPSWTGQSGERIQVEEHRTAQTWVSLEWESTTKPSPAQVMAAIHAVPSAPDFAEGKDVSWTLGAEALTKGTMLQLLSGAVALNGRTGVVKTGQNQDSPFEKVGLKVPVGKQVEKRYFVQVDAPVKPGWGFRKAIDWSILHADLSSISLPRFADIVEAKVRFALSRYASKNKYPGFAMYPGNTETYVMGWAGQAEAPGYALQVLADRLGDPSLKQISYTALDNLARARFNGQGFQLMLNGHSGQWSQQDPVSQGQAMSAFARAVRFGREHGAVTKKWESFLQQACKVHSERILRKSWRPRSTAEAFLIQPLALASGLFNNQQYMQAALKAGDHYAERHIGLSEPFWGGTLDAQCEDKEGAWAGFEAFLALHEATGAQKWLEAASYAADMVLTYTYLWDVDLPPGRLRDHGLHTRGWTAVSVQNMHLDVYGVLYTPRLWRLGQLTNRPELLKLAELMYRTCGQMIDAAGSQGEQLQQTRFAQAGDMSNPDKYRGGYVESWTVFWIAAHFLTAAALFEEMGVLQDLWNRA